MSDEFPWQASGVQLAAYLEELKLLGLADVVIARCSAPTREAMLNPHVARWHSGALVCEFQEAVVAVSDEATLERLSYAMMRRGFGRILRPLVQVTLAVAGGGADAVFGRFAAGMSQSIRGVAATWLKTEPRAGELTIIYPCPAPRYVVATYRGIIRFVGELGTDRVHLAAVDQRSPNRPVFRLTW